MKLVRLSSGEEIIGNVETKTGSIRITDGFSLIPAGEGKIGFMPFMAYTEADKGVDIPERFVMFTVDPKPDLVQQINSMKSGLVVPQKQGIIT